MSRHRIARWVVGAFIAYVSLSLLGTIDARVSGPVGIPVEAKQTTHAASGPATLISLR
jgi:hypothetical protein